MKYKDKSYLQKRDILRFFYKNNPEIKKIIDDLRIPNYMNIKYKILIDGYAVFKKVKVDGNINYLELDPNDISAIFNDDISYWFNKNGEKYKNDEILYFCYDYAGYYTSLIEYMMLNDLTDISQNLKNIIYSTFKSIYKNFNLRVGKNYDKCVKSFIAVSKALI